MHAKNVTATVVVLLGLNAMATGTWEIQGAYETFFPADGLWEGQTHGAEARLVHWWDRRGVGLALSAGAMEWGVEQQKVYESTARTHTLSGKAKTVPLGLSALVHGDLPEYPNLLTTLEAGVRYIIVDSRINLTETLDLGGGPPDQETYPVDYEDGLVARFAAGLELKLSDKRYPAKLFANLGYQFDLMKGDATESEWTGFRRQISLAGTSIQLGLAIPIR